MKVIVNSVVVNVFALWDNARKQLYSFETCLEGGSPEDFVLKSSMASMDQKAKHSWTHIWLNMFWNVL